MYIYFSITISCNFYPRSVPFLVFKLLYFYYYFLLIFFLSFILNIVLLSCKCDTSCKSNPRYKNILSWSKSSKKVVVHNFLLVQKWRRAILSRRAIVSPFKSYDLYLFISFIFFIIFSSFVFTPNPQSKAFFSIDLFLFILLLIY